MRPRAGAWLSSPPVSTTASFIAAAFTAAGIPIEVNTHRGGHQGLLRQRLEQFMLPFFSRVLQTEQGD